MFHSHKYNTLQSEHIPNIESFRVFYLLRLTQEQAAELAGLSHQVFACIERGQKNMRAESIIKLSKSMNVSTDYILLGEGSEIDRNYLLELMEPLNEIQLKCLEEIIKNYLVACGYTVPPF